MPSGEGLVGNCLGLRRRRRGSRGALEMAAGLLHEDVVEGRFDELERRDHQPRLVERSHDRSDLGRSAGDGDREVAAIRGRPVIAEPRHHLVGKLQVGPLDERQVEMRAPDLGLQHRGRALGDDPPAADDPDAVGQLIGLLEVLRREEDRRPLVAQPPDLLPERDPARGVEACCRLVEEQHLGRMDQRHREIEPPAHPAGVRADPALRRLAEPDAIDQVRRPVAHVARRDAVQRRLELHQLTAGHQHVQRRLLQRDADPLAHEVRLGRHVVAGHERAPAGRAQQGDEHPDGGRLARAVGPEEAVHLTCGDLEIDAVDGSQTAFELAFEPLDLDGRHAQRTLLHAQLLWRGRPQQPPVLRVQSWTMRPKHALYAAVASAALALPAAAAAKLTEIGNVQPAATPACPAKPCYALTRTTGYQAKIGTRRGTHVIPRAGRLVAWSITLGKPGKKQIKFFDDNLGGASTAQITVLKPGANLRYRVVGQGQAEKLAPYFGTTVQFALNTSIPVKKGDVLAVTTPTWVPALAVNLPTDTSWRASRAKGTCDETSKQTAQTGANTLAQYYCLYRGARLTYSATFVPDPVAPK